MDSSHARVADAGSAPGKPSAAQPRYAVQMKGITKRFPGVLANDRRRPGSCSRRGPGPCWGKWCRQEYADERPGRALPGGGRRTLCRRATGSLSLAARRHRARHRHGPPALYARGNADRGREHHPGSAGYQPGTSPGPGRQRDRDCPSAMDCKSIPMPTSGSSPSANNSGSRSSSCCTAAQRS